MQTLARAHAASAAPLTTLEGASKSIAGKVVIVLSASLFVAVCAHLVVPLPFTPVPLTLSDLAVLVVGLLLGPEMAFAALALYLAEGAVGLPVFAPAGPGGLAQLRGVTAGYLIAYPFAAAAAGYLVRKMASLPRYAAAVIASLVASTLIMTSGAAWLGFFTHHDWNLTLRLAVMPFVPGQIVKIIAAAGIFTTLAANLHARKTGLQ
jgi:biotin transport system substrate-specific component